MFKQELPKAKLYQFCIHTSPSEAKVCFFFTLIYNVYPILDTRFSVCLLVLCLSGLCYPHWTLNRFKLETFGERPYQKVSKTKSLIALLFWKQKGRRVGLNMIFKNIKKNNFLDLLVFLYIFFIFF